MSDDASWISELIESSARRTADLEAFWTAAANRGYLNRMRVHEYRCEVKGCRLATVIRVRDVVLMKTEPYKLRPHTNEQRSVPAAREKNTLNGKDRWPSYVFDVGQSAGLEPHEWGSEPWGDVFSMGLNCRCRLRTIEAWRVLATIKDVTPGHPGAPTRL